MSSDKRSTSPVSASLDEQVVDILCRDPTLPQHGRGDQAILFGIKKALGQDNVLLITVEQVSIKSMIKYKVGCHAFVCRATAHFHDMLRFEFYHREDIEDYSVFLELGVDSKACVLNISYGIIPCILNIYIDLQ